MLITLQTAKKKPPRIALTPKILKNRKFYQHNLRKGKNKRCLHTLGDSGDFQTSRYQGIEKATVCRVLAETANWADSGQLQFWSEPTEILNIRSSSTPENVAFTIP